MVFKPGKILAALKVESLEPMDPEEEKVLKEACKAVASYKFAYHAAFAVAKIINAQDYYIAKVFKYEADWYLVRVWRTGFRHVGAIEVWRKDVS